MRINILGFLGILFLTTLQVSAQLSNPVIGAAQTICSGGSAVLTGAVPTGCAGTNTYTWQSSNNNITWTTAVSTTNQNYNQVVSANTYFRRITTNSGCVGTPVTSVSVAVTINPNPAPAAPSGIVEDTVCANQLAILQAIFGAGGNQVNWYDSPTQGLLLGNGQFFTPAPPVTTTYYVATVNTVTGCLSSPRLPVVATVEILPIPTGVTVSAARCGSGAVSLSATPGVGGDQVLWYQPTNTQIGSGSPFVYNALTSTTVYVATSNSITLCLSTQVSIPITVYNPIGNNVVNASQALCIGSVGTQLTGLVPTGADGNFTYAWETSSNLIAWNQVAATTAFSPGAPTANTYYRRIVNSTVCPGNTSLILAIQVDNPIIANTILTDQSICTGTAPITLTGSQPSGGDGTSYSYQWQNSTNGVTFNNIGGGNAINYSPPVLAVSTYYRRVVGSGQCAPSTSSSVLITVFPVVTNNTVGSAQTICTGSTPTALTGSVPLGGSGTYIYQWESSSNNFFYNTITGEINQNLTLGPIVTTTYYRRVVSATCSNTSTMVQITANPNVSNNTLSANQTICTGGAGATIVGAPPAGGNGIYTYVWESSNDNATWVTHPGTGVNLSPTSITQNTYYRRIVSSPPCLANTSVSMSITTNPVIGNNSITGAQTTCANTSTVTLTGTLPTGGSGTYTYTWESSTNNVTWVNIGQNTISYLPGVLTTSTYWRRIVNAPPCAASTSASVYVLVYPILSNFNVSASQTICTGASPSNLTGPGPAGGTGSYAFQWESSANNNTWNFLPGEILSSLSPGSLTTVTYYRRQLSSAPCIATSNTIRIDIDLPHANNVIGNDQTICTGAIPATLTGSLPTGGTGTLTYQWQSSSNNITFGPIVPNGTNQNYTSGALTATRYFRRIVNTGACSPLTSAVVTVQVDQLLGNNLIGNNSTICAGSAPLVTTGALPTGGSSPYNYQWESSTNNVVWNPIVGEILQDLTSPVLTNNTYYRRIVTGGACAGITSTSISIAVQPALGLNTIQPSQIICSGTSPQLLSGSTPSGGSGVYTYEWLSSTDNSTFTFITGANASTYSTGPLTQNAYYRRVVISGACNPSTTASQIITVQGLIGNNLIGTNQSICGGTTFATLSGSVPSGGSGAYTYQWQTSGDNITWTSASGLTQQGVTGYVLNSNTYFRRVVSAPPCTASTSGVVTISVQPSVGNNTIGANQTVCAGGVPNPFTGVIPTGGNGVYAYQWESSINNSTWTAITNQTNTGYTPGTLVVITYYRRMVTTGLCSPHSSNLITIQTDNFLGSNLIGTAQTICNGQLPGALTGSLPSGGTGVFTYRWESSTDNSTWGAASGITTNQSYAPPVLFSSFYYRRLVNSGICNSDTSSSVLITVEPFLSGNTIGSAQTICAGSTPAGFTATLPSGGSGTYVFQWQTSTDNATWTNLAGQTNATYSSGSLSSFLYFRRLVTSGTCPNLPSNSVLITVQQGIGNNIIGVDQSICQGSAPNLITGSTPNGGIGFYAYGWEVSNDNLTWTNATGVSNNIDYLSGNLVATTYYRRLAISGVCSNSISNTVRVTVYQIPSVSVGNISICIGTFGTLSATPSSPGGGFVWSTGVVTQNITIGPLSNTTYSVIYTLNGCPSPSAVGLVTVNPLPVPVITSSGSTILCPNGSVGLTASGGNQYVWSTGLVSNSILVSSAGTFRVVVTDANGCVDSTFTSVTQPPPISITPNITNPSCFGFIDGVISLTVTGGTLPYSYSWSTNPIQTLNSAFNLGQGTYGVNVVDFNGCQGSATFGLTEPRPLAVTSSNNTIACTPLLNTGQASTFVVGGTQPYTYAWSTLPVQTTSGAFNLTPGSYTVRVTDARGCVIDDSVTLVTDISPTVIASADTFVCANSGGIQIQANATGGFAPYTYVWSQSSFIAAGSINNVNLQNPIANPDTSGWYYVQAFGSNGCPSSMDSLRITVYQLPIADAGPDVSFCQNAPGAFLIGNVLNPQGGYTVNWYPPNSGLYCDQCLTTYAQPTVSTIYTLVITNIQTGCKSDSTTLNTQSSVLVTVKDLPIVNAGRDTIICLGDSASLLGTVFGAGPLYTWEWSPIQFMDDRTLQNPHVASTSSTLYFVVATSEGCESLADSIYVDVIPYPIVAAGQQKNICRGDSIQLSGQVQQGVAQYFRWVPGTGLSDSTALTPLGSPASTTTYTLYAYNQGCQGPPSSTVLIVKAVPQANAGPDTVICETSDSIRLQGSFTGGYLPFDYRWTPNNNLSKDDIFNPMAKPLVSQYYFFTVSSGTLPDRCTTTDSVLITVIPSVKLQTSVDTNTICPGQAVNFQGSAGFGNPTFQWTPVLGVANPLQPNTTASPLVSTVYVLTASEGGCSESDTFNITVHPGLTAAFDLSQSSGCLPLEIKANDRSSGAMSYQWILNGTQILSNEKNPVFTFKDAGDYRLTLVIRNQGGCSDTITWAETIQAGQEVVASFLSDPPAPIEITGDQRQIYFKDNTPGASEWFWDFGDGNTSNTMNPTHVYAQPGTYQVTLKIRTNGGCEATTAGGPYTIKNAELFISNVFTPNGDGVNDVFYPDYTGDDQFYFQIFDRWGVKIFETRSRQQGWDGKDLNGQVSPEGVYFYTVKAGTRDLTGSISLVK